MLRLSAMGYVGRGCWENPLDRSVSKVYLKCIEIVSLKMDPIQSVSLKCIISVSKPYQKINPKNKAVAT